MNLGGVVHLNKTGLCVMFGALLVLFIYISSTRSNADSSVKINLKDLLKLAIKAAENGGREVVNTKDNLNIKSKGLTKEGLQDSVTTADLLSHCVMKTTLQDTYPTLDIISEESTGKCDKNPNVGNEEIVNAILDNVEDQWEDIKDVTVWIDPLDATKEYTEQLYQYVTTMVCVAVKGNPIMGVIHKPFLKEVPSTSWAWVKKANSPNLKYTDQKNDKLKITISRSHSGEIRKLLDKTMKNYEIVEAAGAGFKVLEVAAGNADAYIHVTAIKKWDICAGNAIINAMGGKMTTRSNKNIDYKASADVVNEEGLVVTIKNHELFEKI